MSVVKCVWRDLKKCKRKIKISLHLGGKILKAVDVNVEQILSPLTHMVSDNHKNIILPPGKLFLPRIEYCGALGLVTCGSSVLYLPGPGVLARSSEKHPVWDLRVIENAADAFLFGIFAPKRAGRLYELGEGVASPENLEINRWRLGYREI